MELYLCNYLTIIYFKGKNTPAISEADGALNQPLPAYETAKEATIEEILSLNVDETPCKKMKFLERENDDLAKQLTEKDREIDYLKAQLELEAEERLAKSKFLLKSRNFL